MMTIDKHIKRVLQHVEGSPEERQELVDEMKDHLLLAKEEYIEQGFSPDEAEQKAIADFGGDVEVGDQLQETISPYRKDVLFGLGIASIVFAVSVFLHGVIEISEPHPVWLVVLFSLGLFMTVAGLYPSIAAGRRIMMTVMFFSYFPLIFWGLLIIDTTDNWYKSPLEILAGIIAVLIVVSLFMTLLRSGKTASLDSASRKKRVIFHTINILLGIVIIPYSFMFGLGTLIFGGMDPMLLMPFGLVLLWSFSYWGQMKFYRRRPLISIGFLSADFLAVLLVVFRYIT
ncbi:permease prefix domain 1-containing protein [Bacillus salacetis]|uniref:permease prefix domain 1-containing protein n=1 Tax=Bacillus salacetis TaxID=2315464 RepID=UPI003BA36897